MGSRIPAAYKRRDVVIYGELPKLRRSCALPAVWERESGDASFLRNVRSIAAARARRGDGGAGEFDCRSCCRTGDSARATRGDASRDRDDFAPVRAAGVVTGDSSEGHDCATCSDVDSNDSRS